ncbi:hypothetical protein F4860DRAFT_182575 [Xylaria cubensis]|nr:hypothetical protein F4860DRAFT_182575 [Xylaria cubensis]
MSEDVSRFLSQVKELGERRVEEDEARSRELEEKILQDRKERQARRRGKSLYPLVAFVPLVTRAILHFTPCASGFEASLCDWLGHWQPLFSSGCRSTCALPRPEYLSVCAYKSCCGTQCGLYYCLCSCCHHKCYPGLFGPIS